VARCSVGLAGDQDPANDTLSQGFAVVGRPDWPGGWREVAAVPDQPTTKQVKEGGWIAAHAADGLVYAAKGYKTREFFCYDPTGDSWSRKADIYEGGAGKLPSKGAAGVSDGARYIYATKGNNTLEFYRYDVTCDSWYGLDPVPTGTHKVKGGTDLAYISHADTGYVYLLKGFKNEFYRFNTTTLHWQDEVSAPDLSGYKYDKGSFLVSDNATALYAHQAKTHRLYRFDVPGRAWSTDLLNGMPGHSNITGQNKKSKDGGCAAWSGDGFYALKGNNTQEYFRYFPVGDSWQELDTLPAWGRITQRKKKVKAGSDITSYDSGILFALKGNKTRECWRWVDWPAAFTDRPSRGGITASSFDIRHPSLVIAPNPLRSGFLSVSFTSSLIPHPSSLSVYDPLGRRIRAFGTSHSTSDIDLSALPAGVYLVRLAGNGATVSQKLIIER
jgi:hypothetical protein